MSTCDVGLVSVWIEKMSRQVVISGDDYGISEAFSIGALRTYRQGVVSVLALMVNLPTSEFAVELRREWAPEAPLSLHFNVVLGAPLSAPKDIPSLVDENGLFYRSSQWKSDEESDSKCRGSVYPKADDVAREALAQIKRFRELVGHYPTHIDCHSVMVRPVAEGLHRVARPLGIHCEGDPCLRPDIMRPCAECMPLGGNRERVAITSRGASVDDWLADVFGIAACPHDIAVVHVHPGYIDQQLIDSTSLVLPRCKDQKVLTDRRVRDWFNERGIEIVAYDAIYPDVFQEPDNRTFDLLCQELGVECRFRM